MTDTDDLAPLMWALDGYADACLDFGTGKIREADWEVARDAVREKARQYGEWQRLAGLSIGLRVENPVYAEAARAAYFGEG